LSLGNKVQKGAILAYKSKAIFATTELLHSDFYLGASTVLRNAVWQRLGRDNVLVTEESVTAYEAVRDAVGSAEADGSESNEKDGNGLPELKAAELRRLFHRKISGLRHADSGRVRPSTHPLLQI
jgi:hypothetical protein